MFSRSESPYPGLIEGRTMTETTTGLLKLGDEYGAHNYHPLPIVAAEAEGAWVSDVEGRGYLDMLAASSALTFARGTPRLTAAAQRQLERLTLVSRAFQHDQFGPFCAELADLAGMEVVLPMNTGAEAVETAIKVARKWGYTVKGVPRDQAVSIAFDGNFHGRTTTIVSFSTDPDARDDFGPYTPGFRVVPYGDLDALTAVVAELGERVVAVLVEPIQGEAGVVVPPPGFLAGIRASCRSPRWGRRGRCSACCTPGSTGPRSAATRWPARSAGRSSRCCAPASTRREQGFSASGCTPGCTHCRPRWVAACAGAGCGPGSSSRRCPGARCASGSRPAACWPRKPTAP